MAELKNQTEQALGKNAKLLEDELSKINKKVEQTAANNKKELLAELDKDKKARE